MLSLDSRENGSLSLNLIVILIVSFDALFRHLCVLSCFGDDAPFSRHVVAQVPPRLGITHWLLLLDSSIIIIDFLTMYPLNKAALETIPIWIIAVDATLPPGVTLAGISRDEAAPVGLGLHLVEVVQLRRLVCLELL